MTSLPLNKWYVIFFTDLCNYVRKLLGMEGNIFNVVTIARLLEVPEELMHQVTSSWEDDCQQLNLSLQHWSEKSAGVENLSSLRKCLEGINEEGQWCFKRPFFFFFFFFFF